MWKLIDSLKLIIHHQTALIESTKVEIEEVKRHQNVLRDQNDKLHEEVRAMRAQIETLPPAPPSRSSAAVAASGSVASPQLLLQRPEKDQNCVRISTQRLFVDPEANNNSNCDLSHLVWRFELGRSYENYVSIQRMVSVSIPYI